MKIVLAGSGNVAYSLALSMKQAGIGPLQIFSRNRIEGESLAVRCHALFTDDPHQILHDADLCLLAVSDRAIPEVSHYFSRFSGVVAHTAGSVALDAINNTDRAVIYPVQTFTKERSIDLSRVPFLIEAATTKALHTARIFASTLSQQVIEADSEKRARVHLAAVFACNFVNGLYAVSDRILSGVGLEFDLFSQLITETASKAAAVGNPALAQTGPAVREDMVVINRQLELLKENPQLAALYRSLSEIIWETSKKI